MVVFENSFPRDSLRSRLRHLTPPSKGKRNLHHQGLLRPPTRRVFAATLSCFLLATSASFAQTGVSDDRVSLPDGPGSLDGVGDNASVNPNMGMMAFTIPISVPKGVRGQTPDLTLNYSSGGGNGPFGMGWSMASPSIERMTSKGLPLYDDTDRFVANGSSELIRISDGEPAIYRARYEGSFIRYAWHNRGSGDEGYWTAEFPDGRVSTFGAANSGSLVETSRVRSPDGVFRYLLVDARDLYGNRISYDYTYYGSVPLLDSVGYVFGADDTPRFSARFDYETREDPISDARGGFNERTAHRATDIRIFSRDALIRRYSFGYEPYADSGGVSRLVDVTRFGEDAGEYGVRYTMEYSRALAGVCDGTDCDAPVMTTAGSIGAGFGTGRVNLIDLNGDSLPDAVYTPPTGAHQIFLGTMSTSGEVNFAAPFDSAVGDSGSFEMSSPYTQVIDYDGDGFTDLLDSLSGRVLVNRGVGDWDRVENLGGTANLPDFAEDFELDGENELTHIRFTDIDGDRLIDVLRSDASGTSLFKNQGSNGFSSVPVDEIEAGFADDSTDLADVNGDGLLDPVQLRDGVLRYRLSLGRGKWAAWAEMTAMPFDIDDIPFVELEDLNGDGLDDVILVQGSEVRYALNRNAAAFSAAQVISSANGAPLPNADDTVTVLYADMNANGSNDVVWIDDNGEVQFLDLFPIRPHLLSRLENGVGYTVDVTYGSMALERARNPDGWDNPVPMATLVVTSLDVYTQAESAELIVNDLVSYSYSGGFYDGVEKQFRGFAQATLTQPLDDGEFRSTSVYDVGAGDDRGHFAGLELETHLFDSGVEVQSIANVYEDCAVSDVGAAGAQIRWACNTASETVLKEQAPEAEWVTTRQESEYDGYGNVIKASNFGFTAIGGGACPACDRVAGEGGAPCGAQCLGDEVFIETDFIPPSAVQNAYQLSLPQEVREYTVEGGPQKVIQSFYDGAPFVGEALGTATRGVLVRETRLAVEGEPPLEPIRREVDTFGNVVDQVRAGQNISDGDHLRAVYSSDGRDLIRLFREVENGGEMLTHVADFAYTNPFGKVSSATGWYLDGIEDGEERRRFWTYDEHGRVSAEIKPGNSIDSPSVEYEYDLGSPYTRIVTRKRSTVGGPLDIEEINCIDGLGRATQSRAKSTEGTYLVAAFTTYDRAGNPVRVFQPFTATDSSCSAPPDDVRSSLYVYDGLDRLIRTVEPSSVEGEEQTTRKTFLPDGEVIFTADDTDEASDGFETPTTITIDGQERVVQIERAQRGGALETYRFEYDALGRASTVVSPEGLAKEQVYDLADRVVLIRDADSGETTFLYNNSSDAISVTDGRGKTVEREYDKIGRKIAEWDADDADGTRTDYFYDRHPDCPTNQCTWGAARLVGARTQSQLGPIVDGTGFAPDGTLVHAFRQIGGGPVLKSDITLDNANRVVAQSYNGGITLQMPLDNMGRPTAIEGIVDAISYNAFGQIGSIQGNGGVTTTFGFDARQDLQSIVAPGVLDLTVSRDAVGVVTAIDDQIGTGALSLTAAFDFDDLSRLQRATLSDETIDYTVDSLDRLLSKTSSVSSSDANVGDFSYGADNPRAVTAAGSVAFTYDAGGFVTQRGADRFTFDVFGRLSGIAGGTATVAIDRDGNGKRTVAQIGTEQRLYLGRGLQVRDGIARVRVLVGEETVAFVESSSEASVLLGVSDAARPVTAADAIGSSGADQRTRLRSGARRLLIAVAGETTFVHNDHLGSTVAVSNTSGDVVERLSYYPFGQIRDSSAQQTEWSAFTGVEDDGLGYLDYNNRVYSPREGRWLSPDPLFIGLNSAAFRNPAEAFTTYAYVGNSPTTLIDIDGFEGDSTAKKVATATATAAGVGGAILTGVAAAATTAGTANIVGAIAQGSVSGAREAHAQRQQMRQEYPDGNVPVAREAWAALNVAYEATVGAAAGFATAGASLIPTAVSVGADAVLQNTDNTSARAAARGAKLATATVGLATGNTDASAVLSAVGGVASAAAASGALDGPKKPAKAAKSVAKKVSKKKKASGGLSVPKQKRAKAKTARPQQGAKKSGPKASASK